MNLPNWQDLKIDFILIDIYDDNKRYYHLNINSENVGEVEIHGIDKCKQISVWGLEIKPEYQGKGYGHILINQIEKHAILIGARLIKLYVESDNIKAINMYLKNNFKKRTPVIGQENFKMSKLLR